MQSCRLAATAMMGQTRLQSPRPLTMLDIVARVFRLGDLNEENFGRTKVSTAERSYEKWKLFDFTIPENMAGRYDVIGSAHHGDEIDEDGEKRTIGACTEGFIRGNGVLRYPVVLRERREKIAIGNAAVDLLEQGRRSLSGNSHRTEEKRKMALSDGIERAFHDVVDFMNHPAILLLLLLLLLLRQR